MIRSAFIITGLALIAIGLAFTILRFHTDGLSTLAIAGLAVAAVANRWEQSPS